MALPETDLPAPLDPALAARENLRICLMTERQLMANEVHDTLAQGLTYMRMRMSLLRDAIRDGDEARAIKYWNDLDTSLTDAHRRLRELITYFRSRMDPRGLLHALEEMTETFLDRTGVVLEFANHVGELAHLPVGREVQVFHIVQEALANVCKHANARQARLTLEPKGAGYEIVVEDDGAGMPSDVAADLVLFGAASMMHLVQGLKNAGRNLTTESMIKGMEMIKLEA